jgi:lysophospholipase L1-like esterase
VPHGSAAPVAAVVLSVLAVLTAPSVLRHAIGHLPVDETSRQPVVVVLGDSFVAGTMMNRGQTWPDIAGLKHGWIVYSDAVADTGYLSPGFSRTPFPARAAALARAYTPDVMIVAGGLNDVAARYPTSRILDAADRTFRTCRSGLPAGAQLVVLSPFAAGARPSAAVTALSAALRPVAERDGATYVDVTGYLDEPGRVVGSDHVHPTDRGQRLLARKIAEALIALHVLRP